MDRRYKYDQLHTVQIRIKLNRRTDADILARLAEQENRQGYIKRRVREDIAREKQEKE